MEAKRSCKISFDPVDDNTVYWVPHITANVHEDLQLEDPTQQQQKEAITITTTKKAAPTDVELHEELARLNRKHDELLEKKRQVDEHIKALYEYNRIKDISQELIGRLAQANGCRTVDMYHQFNLELDD